MITLTSLIKYYKLSHFAGCCFATYVRRMPIACGNPPKKAIIVIDFLIGFDGFLYCFIYVKKIEWSPSLDNFVRRSCTCTVCFFSAIAFDRHSPRNGIDTPVIEAYLKNVHFVFRRIDDITLKWNEWVFDNWSHTQAESLGTVRVQNL